MFRRLQLAILSVFASGLALAAPAAANLTAAAQSPVFQHICRD